MARDAVTGYRPLNRGQRGLKIYRANAGKGGRNTMGLVTSIEGASPPQSTIRRGYPPRRAIATHPLNTAARWPKRADITTAPK